MPQVITRAPDLDVHEVPDGYIVYHGSKDTVSYLNKTAAIVFEFCDGKRSADDIVERAAKIFESAAVSPEEIKTCIDSLVKEGLILSSAT